MWGVRGVWGSERYVGCSESKSYEECLYLTVKVYPCFFRCVLHKHTARVLFMSLQAATERVWILKVLVDGLRTEQDYKLYKKLGITSSVMAFWHSNIVEPEAKVEPQLCWQYLLLYSCALLLTRRV